MTRSRIHVLGTLIVAALLAGFGSPDPLAQSPSDPPITPVPPGYGYYCSVGYSSGGWAFSTFAGTNGDPCGQLLSSSPGGTIDRAGLWAISGENSVLVRCEGFVFLQRGAGGTPITVSYNSAQGQRRCVFTVSPAALPVFGRPYGAGPGQGPDAGVSHVQGKNFAAFGPLDVTEFGQPGGAAAVVDHLGRKQADTANHDGHDWAMAVGRPITAVADGIVRRLRERDVRSYGCTDQPQQKEIYIEHQVGAGVYAERFISYYAHMSEMLGAEGNRVSRGRIIGVSGNTGCSSGPHLHFGVTRLTNLTGVRTFVFQTHDLGRGDNGFRGRIDPYGWRAPQQVDPYAWKYVGDRVDGPDQGAAIRDPGAFSIELWRPGEAPPNRW